MRKNRNTRVETAPVQGEGSYVVFTARTWNEYLALPDTMTMAEAAITSISEWNWVDDDGNPLPVPRENPEVFKELLAVEVTFLYDAYLKINGKKEGNDQPDSAPAVAD